MMAFPAAPRGADETLALLYDWEHDAYTADLDLYIPLARRTGGPVLELACGSGRVLKPLAELGMAVAGVDVSAAMLARAASRLHRAGLTARLTQRDMTRFVPEGPFGLVILALSAFGFVHEPDDQTRLLGRIAAGLRADGLVVLDLVNGASLVDVPVAIPVLQRAGWSEELGAEVMKWMVQDVSFADQRIELRCLYDVVDRAGGLTRLSDHFEMRFFSRFEVGALCKMAGLRVEAIYGGYALEPLQDASERMIVVAGRA